MTPTISRLVAGVTRWMRREAGGTLLVFRLATTPVPASRPRVSRWGTYYGKTYARFRAAALPLASAFEGFPTTAPVFVLLENVVARPKTGKRAHPRGDVDNYAKGVLDVLTQAKKFWEDDDQVVGLTVFKRYAAPGEEAGIRITWFEVEAT